MEENKKQKKKRSVVDTSVVLSFVVAIFAVFSLAMAGLSMNQKSGVSYALNYDDTEHFQLEYEDEDVLDPATGQTQHFDEKNYIAKDTNGHVFEFPLYYANSIAAANRVFCIERGNEVNRAAYNRTLGYDEDPGLMYLLNLGYNNRDLAKINSEWDYSDNIDAWVIQSSIWLYLAETRGNDGVYKLVKNDGTGYDDLAVMTANGTITIQEGRGGSPVPYSNITKAIRTLVNNAKSAVKAHVSVSAESSEYSKTEDGKFFVSALINVTGEPSSALTSFDVALSGINGATLIDQDGKEVGLTGIAPGTKLYVRVPSDNVTEKGQTVKLNVTGHFANSRAYKYTGGADSPQAMALLQPGTDQAGVELVFAPDTGMNTTQTIYFIGLIVLLCGVGIVYANAKPVQVKQ